MAAESTIGSRTGKRTTTADARLHKLHQAGESYQSLLILVTIYFFSMPGIPGHFLFVNLSIFGKLKKL